MLPVTLRLGRVGSARRASRVAMFPHGVPHVVMISKSALPCQHSSPPLPVSLSSNSTSASTPALFFSSTCQNCKWSRQGSHCSVPDRLEGRHMAAEISC